MGTHRRMSLTRDWSKVVLLVKVMELWERWSSVARRGTGEGGRIRPRRLHCMTLPWEENNSLDLLINMELQKM